MDGQPDYGMVIWFVTNSGYMEFMLDVEVQDNGKRRIKKGLEWGEWPGLVQSLLCEGKSLIVQQRVDVIDYNSCFGSYPNVEATSPWFSTVKDEIIQPAKNWFTRLLIGDRRQRMGWKFFRYDSPNQFRKAPPKSYDRTIEYWWICKTEDLDRFKHEVEQMMSDESKAIPQQEYLQAMLELKKISPVFEHAKLLPPLQQEYLQAMLELCEAVIVPDYNYAGCGERYEFEVAIVSRRFSPEACTKIVEHLFTPYKTKHFDRTLLARWLPEFEPLI